MPKRLAGPRAPALRDLKNLRDFLSTEPLPTVKSVTGVRDLIHSDFSTMSSEDPVTLRGFIHRGCGVKAGGSNSFAIFNLHSESQTDAGSVNGLFVQVKVSKDFLKDVASLRPFMKDLESAAFEVLITARLEVAAEASEAGEKVANCVLVLESSDSQHKLRLFQQCQDITDSAIESSHFTAPFEDEEKHMQIDDIVKIECATRRQVILLPSDGAGLLKGEVRR
jgi:hypothetical protein